MMTQIMTFRIIKFYLPPPVTSLLLGPDNFAGVVFSNFPS